MRRGATGVRTDRSAHRRRRVLVAVLAVTVLLGSLAAPASAEAPGTDPGSATPSFNIEPEVVTKDEAEEVPPSEPDPADVPEASEEGDVAPASEQDQRIARGEGSAQLQTREAKRLEARQACVPEAKRLAISSMIGLPGSVGGGGAAEWGVLLLAVALISGAVALAVWRRRSRRGVREPRDPLETGSTLVALISGVVGLVLTFVPGIGIDDPPPPSAQMSVRQAHARITHGEYVRRLRTDERLSTEDKREVGNVIWLELRLEGYRDKPLRLQYGSYRAQPGGALLPATTRQINLGRDRDDVETTFVPIWIGYPRKTEGLSTFQAQFRLINPSGQILQLARTGKMAASQYRYACPRG